MSRNGLGRQTQTFRRPISGPWGTPMWFITSCAGTLLAVSVVDIMFPGETFTRNGIPVPEWERNVDIIMLGALLTVCWVAFLCWMTRRYKELRVGPEGLTVFYPLGRARVIPWRQIGELEEHLPNRAHWILRTTNGLLAITGDLANCMQLIAVLAKRVPVVRPKIAKADTEPAPGKAPWEGIAPRRYRCGTHWGWLIGGPFLGSVLLLWCGVALAVIEGRLFDAANVAAFATGWSSFTGPMGWYALVDWRRCRGFEVRVTQTGIEVSDGHGKHTAHRWDDVVGFNLKRSNWELPAQHRIVTRREIVGIPEILRRWRELQELVLEAATFNLRDQAESEMVDSQVDH